MPSCSGSESVSESVSDRIWPGLALARVRIQHPEPGAVSRHLARPKSRDLACFCGGLGCFWIPVGSWNLSFFLLETEEDDPVEHGLSV